MRGGYAREAPRRERRGEEVRLHPEALHDALEEAVARVDVRERGEDREVEAEGGGRTCARGLWLQSVRGGSWRPRGYPITDRQKGNWLTGELATGGPQVGYG